MSDGNGAGYEPSAEVKGFMEEWKKGMFADLQDAIKSESADTVKNIEAKALEIQEKISAEQTARKAAEKLAQEQEERIKLLELQAAKGSSKGGDGELGREGPGYKNFIKWCQFGDAAEGLDAKSINDSASLSAKTLRTDVNTDGGFLLPEVMDAEIRKNITETSPVRLYARVRPAAGKSIKVTRRGSLANTTGAPYEGELEEGEEGHSKYVEETVTLYRQSWTVPVSRDQLMMSGQDVESEIMTDVMEMFAVGEGRRNISGNGLKGPKGIVSDTRVEVVTSNTTNLIDFTDLAEITGQLKHGYNPMWFFNRKTFAELIKFKGSDGHPIWMPIPAGGSLPPTLLGYQYSSEMIHMDEYTASAANQKPIMFGDMSRCYEIFDLAGVHVIRDDYTGKKKAQVEFTFDRYHSGQVILPEAMKILKTKA
ncbi:MAG: phage major capsid protein [Filomicrobium sp.]